MNRKTKASLFLTIICIQYLLLGFNIINVSANNNIELENPETDQSIQGGTSHSSPYYFPTNQSTPLMTEEASEVVEEDFPNQASYYYYNDGYVLTLNLDKYVLTPGETVTINLALTQNLTASEGEYISIKIYDDFYRDFRWYDPDYYDSMVPIHTRNMITNGDGQASFSFSSTSETGIYTVYAYIEETKAYKEFSVGNTGVFCKGPIYFKPDHAYTAAVHVVNISDFTGIPFSSFNYSISYYEYSISDWFLLTTEQVQTDDMGYAIFNVEIPIEMNDYYALKLTLRTSDGEAEYETYLYKSWDYYYYSLWGGQQPTSQEKIQYVVTTDKTIYSPGEFINLRAIVLDYSFMNESKRALKNTPISLTIYNPDDLAIFWSTLVTDEHGILTYTLPLDEDCELGDYGFEFSISSHKHRHNVRVDFYEKPVFRVEIDTNGKDYYSGLDNNFKGFVYVSYYFGQPVVGASVELTLIDYQGNTRKIVKGFTNSEGRFFFAIDLFFIHNLIYSFSVEVDVVDTYGREASTSKTYSRTKALFAYGYLSNWAPHPNEFSEYYFYVYQYVMLESEYGWWNWNYNPLANVSVKIDIYGINGYPYYLSGIFGEILLQTYYAETNNFGSGKLEFKLPLIQIGLFDLFEIRLTVKLEDSRTTTSSYYYRYKKYSLDISIVDSTLDPGQDLEFDVTFKNILTGLPSVGEGRIYIYDSKHQLIGRVNQVISGTKRYSLKVPSFYPEGIYYIYSSVYSRANEYYGGFSYHSAHESFKVGSFQTVSFETNFTNTGTYYDQITVQQDDVINITGKSNVSTNLPLFMEIYKRGILYSVPLEVIDDKFEYLLTIIDDYAPDFTIIVYTISNSGKLYESVLSVHVDYSFDFELTTDKEIYEPGDTITLTITPSENKTSMFAISFIDSAVLDVEPEDDSELAYFTKNSYYTYISSGSSWGSGFDYRSYWWYWCGTPSGGMYQLYDSFLMSERVDAFTWLPGGVEANVPSFEDILIGFDTDIRINISESANWMPKLIISEPTELSFKLPDNIGEWTIRVVGSSLSDNPNNVVLAGAVETVRIKTFLPFFVEFELPQPITQDDILNVKGYVYNYIGTDVQAYVAIDAPNLVVLNKEVQILTIPNGLVSEVEFSVYCKEPFLQNITLLAATNVSGTLYSDAKVLTTYIRPNGIEVVNRTIGFLNVSDSPLLIDYSLDPLAIYHKETLSLYTDLMDISIDSWRSLIGYPYGCIEQTISKLLPSALMFDYLNKTGQLTPSLEKEITLMVLEGLSRIYNFQHIDGGWGWWRDDSSKVIMTSIVVSALNQVEVSGFHVNPSILQKGIEYLIDHQHFNGEWDFQQYSSNALEATAYVLKAIMKYQNVTSEIETSINKAVDRFSELWYSGEMKSSYAAALYFISTIGTSYQNGSFNDILIQYLKDNKQIEDNSVYWESDQGNPWYWQKLGNEVEITAYATLALAIDDYIDNYAVIQKAVRYLINQRNRWGWRTTADTAAVIVALTEIKQIASSLGFINFNGTINISVNDAYPSQYFLNVTENSNIPSEILLSLSEYINQGSNSINISLTGVGQICYILESVQILRSNPKVEIPDLIEVSKGEHFNLSVSFLDIDDRMPIRYATISITDVPEEIQDPVEDYSKFVPLITNGSEISFSLLASSLDFLEFIIKGVKVTGFIRFGNSDDSSSYQLFHRTVGPVSIKLGSGPVIAKESKYHSLIEKLHSSDTNSSETLTLAKEVSKTSNLLPGDVITTTITVLNKEGSKQFYVLEDAIPTGTTFLPESVGITGGNSSEITFDLYSTGVHFFFPILPNGTTEITYQLQINAIKNSYSGQCKIWGMYDDICVTSQSVTLENIPLMYYANHSIYRDILPPTFSNIIVEQDDLSSEVEVIVQFRAFDNNQISKIRVIFAQSSGWRARTLYASQTQELFTLTLTRFKNIESEVVIFVEVYDIYGNIATSPIRRITIVEVIPYIILGTIVGFAIGLASLASFFLKRAEHKKQLAQDEKLKKKQQKVSFIDSTDEPQDELIAK